MKQVTAYADESGCVHKDPMDAIKADFVAKVKSAWAEMPVDQRHGDPALIANALCWDKPYSAARQRLLDALLWYNEQISALNAEQPIHPVPRQKAVGDGCTDAGIKEL